MSLLEQIARKKKYLNTTSTVITRVDGSTYLETSAMRISGAEPEKLEMNKCGFVVDTKPDKVPAEIIKGLYLGSQDCADDSVLQFYKITHILSVGVDSYTSLENKMFIEFLDLPESNIDKLLNKTSQFIDRVLKDDGVLLVHCNAGVSRSATVVIGYLIQMKDYSYDDAYALVKTKRPSIQPNVGFIKQLKVLRNS